MSLKTPPQDETRLVEEPSVLHFTQVEGGGDQMTSIILGALGGCNVTLNFFKITKLEMLEDATAVERFPQRAVLDKTLDKDDFQGIFYH